MNQNVEVTALKIVLATILLLVAVWRWIAPSPYRGRGVIAMLCASSALWCVASILMGNGLVPERVASAILIFATGYVGGFALMATHHISVLQDEAQAWWVRVVLVIEPIAVAALALGGVAMDDRLRGSTLYAFHLVYLFAVAMSIVVVLASRQYAPGLGPTVMLYGLQFLLVATVLAELFGSQLACIIAGVTALVVASLSRHPDDVFVLATTRREILDGLGAYVFAFDREGMLRDWNVPAEQLLAQTGLAALKPGLPATKVLGTSVPLSEDHSVIYDTTAGLLELQGYTVEASRDERERGHRWIVVLQSVDSSRRIVGEETQLDPTTHTLSRSSIIERLRNAAVDPNKPVAMRVDVDLGDVNDTDNVMARVAGRLMQLCPTLHIGRIERLALAAIVPARVDAERLCAQVTFDDDLGVPLVATVVKPTEDGDADDFVREVLTSTHLDGERRWQPRWY